MARFLLLIGTLAALVGLAGCFSGKIEVPEGYGVRPPPPPGTIAPATPGSRDDAIRENQQLRDRVAWLEDDIRRQNNKYDKLGRDNTEIKADINKLSAERDSYKREAGR